MVSRQAATGFSGSGTLKARALREANDHCTKTGKTLHVTRTEEARPPYILANFPKAEIHFMCLDASDPRLPHSLETIPKPSDKAARIPGELDPFLAAVATVITTGGHGSAFRVTPDGYYFTNAHVVGNSSTVTLKDHEGALARARVIYLDRTGDVSVLRGPVGDTYLRLRQGAAIGEEVWAVGAPKEFEFSASRGIVSAIRQLAGMPFVQTDAAINPGNSGGPLIAVSDGLVLGMNTGKRIDSEGLGFAVSSTVLQAVLEEIGDRSPK